MSNDNSLAIDKNLIDYYIDAVSNLIAMYQAKDVAKAQEEYLVDNIRAVDSTNGVFVRPEDIPTNIQDQLIKESLNAHLSKVQSEQISQKTIALVTQLEQEAKSKFLNKKITVKKLNQKSDCFEAVLVDKSGNYRVSNYTGDKITGVISDLSFEKNVLILKPTMLSKMITPNRIQFHVYVIDLKTMQPDIEIL